MSERRQDIAEERRQQIMEGALRVFSKSGFVKATNKEVAEAAGIQSPGLIYHYFKDKADLLRAVIERYAPPLQLLTHADEIMELPPVEALTRFGSAYMQLIDDPHMGACMRVVFSEALREPAFARVLFGIGPIRMLRFLSGYLKRQMEAGQLREMDPELAARCFMGPLLIHLLARKIFQVPDLAPAAPEAVVQAAVTIFLQGMTPKETP